MTARRASTVAVGSVLAVVLATLLLVVVVAWASSIGPGRVLRGNGPSPAGTPTASTASASPSGEPTAQPAEPEQQPGTSLPLLRAVAFVINVAVLVLVGYGLLLLLRTVARSRRARRSRRAVRAEEPEFDVLARGIFDDAEEQRRTLFEGSPRNGVVACWHRFETGAAAAGLQRHVWETSSEYTLRVLDLVDAHQPAVSELARLYREARFSEHELTEADRQAAADALETIHRTIGVTT